MPTVSGHGDPDALPRIDEHLVEIAADREGVWRALLSELGGPARRSVRVIATLLGCSERRPTGPLDQPGSTLAGFRVVAAERPTKLALAGKHRFSRYALTFRIEGQEGSDRSLLKARTDAWFPGLQGQAYRALVIGSRAHARLTRAMLARIRSRAEGLHGRRGDWRIERQIEISCPIEEVFAFVADPRNDPHWCPRVVWCEQRGGDGPGLGARYEALHRPTLQRMHTRSIELVGYAPPTLIRSSQCDDIGDFTITYLLETSASGTRLVQRDEIAWKISPISRPVARQIVKKHISDQQRDLKRLLERGAPSTRR